MSEPTTPEEDSSGVVWRPGDEFVVLDDRLKRWGVIRSKAINGYVYVGVNGTRFSIHVSRIAPPPWLQFDADGEQLEPSAAEQRADPAQMDVPF